VSHAALRAGLAALCLPVLGSAARAQELTTPAFTLRCDESGVRSLKRTSDVHDTDYIAPGAALGRLLVRYRTTPNGDWRQLRDAVIRRQAGQPASIEYGLGAALPALASKASPSAERGVGGLRALSDGLVPAASGPGAAAVPTFAWTPEPNEPGGGGPNPVVARRWIQYTFPVEVDVSRTEVFWTAPPQSWRLLYLENSQWKAVAAHGPYTVTANAFASVEFTPVRTLALRIEVTLPPGVGASVAEWRVGPEPPLAMPSDLAVTERFDVGTDVLDWTITLANLTSGRVEIADLGVPLPFAERTPPRECATSRLWTSAECR